MMCGVMVLPANQGFSDSYVKRTIRTNAHTYAAQDMDTPFLLHQSTTFFYALKRLLKLVDDW
jgi:hypothetical protein